MRTLIAALLTLVAPLALGQTVTLTATPTSGISPVNVTLTWSSTGVTSCAASGGWSGAKATSGTQTLTGVTATATYTLTCSAGTGTAVLSWTPPTQNTDGSALTNLASYRVFHASTTGGVSGATPISVPAPANGYTVTGLPAGTRHFGVRAVSSTGVESDLSNLASKTVTIASASDSATVTIDTKPNPPTLVTVSIAAYDLQERRNGSIYIGRIVGVVPRGTECGEMIVDRIGNRDFYEIPREAVRYMRQPRSERVVARCGVDNG